VRELQRTVRPDLKLVVRSATRETEALASYLEGSTVLTSEGRAFPVQIEFAPAADDRPLPGRVATALRRVLSEQEGDGLVFLPGAGEIRRTAEALAALAAAHDLLVLPLQRSAARCAATRVAPRCAAQGWCWRPTSPKPR
jgi:ATP-dependent helicase HrpB